MNVNLENLTRRSELLYAVRQSFLARGLLEVETPLLAEEVIPELHIEPMVVSRAMRGNAATSSQSRVSTQHTAQPTSYLQASPELHMKRLLAAGMNAIFQITRSFRDGEQGQLHNPEFTMVEWYRVGDDMQAGMNLLDELLQETLQTPPARRTTYADAFQQHLDIDPHSATTDELAQLGVEPADGMRTDDRDEWLNLLLTTRIESQLGRGAPEILYQYPASQAALAKMSKDRSGRQVAQRFELYWKGIELANGYDELTDADELRARLERVNMDRVVEGRDRLPLPESLLSAMEQGLPSCAGCALGFDRLTMLACDADSLDEVMPFQMS